MDGRSSQLWFNTARVGWRFAAAVCVVWTLLLIALARSAAGDYLEARIASPVNFHVRHMLHRDPVLAGKLRIYGVDDTTVFKIKKPALSGHDWAAVFSVLVKSEPEAIVIDGMFSQADDYIEEFQRGLAELRAHHIAVIVGAFFNPVEIAFRTPLQYRSEYDIRGMIPGLPNDPAGDAPIDESLLPPMRSNRDGVAYGPATTLGTEFTHVGHFSYEGDGRVAAMIRIDKRLQIGRTSALDHQVREAAVAHMSLYLARQLTIQKGKLLLDDELLPIASDGYVTVNFPHPLTMQERVLPLWPLLDKAAKGQASSVVKKGDVVFIIPQNFTGNTDFAQTPFGMIPGAFVIAGMLNSVITAQWLKPLVGVEGFILAMAALGAALGMNFGVGGFALAIGAVMVGGLALSTWLFSYYGIVVPWLLPLTAFFAVAASIFAEKTRLGEKKVQALRASLSGLVAPDDLKNLLKKPDAVDFEARERVVTLMFIDVVGFSLLAENILPRIAFEQLKRMLASLGDCVHEFGGIIDKTLGDGLLCYFGYRFDSDHIYPDHAEQALRCAVKIQQENLARNIEAARSGEAIHPLRIGINTASCYLGDLGSANRIDFTVVGNGVNFAKRLEGACEMHCVLMGATTSDLVRGIGLPAAGFNKRLIRIKHHSELVEAYEYDPFFAEPQLRLEALEGFRKYAKIDRVDQRWPVHDPSRIRLNTNLGPGQLVNFSYGSLGIKLKQLLPPGTLLHIVLDDKEGALSALLQERGMNELSGEVRWGYSEGAEFVHGVILRSINDTQSEVLVQHLCDFAFDHGEADASMPKAS